MLRLQLHVPNRSTTYGWVLHENGERAAMPLSRCNIRRSGHLLKKERKPAQTLSEPSSGNQEAF